MAWKPWSVWGKGGIDLVLLDIMMPRLDGIAALMKIREESHIPVIILSAKTEDSDKVYGLAVGGDDYISKPYNPAELCARVKALLRRYRAWNDSGAKAGTAAGGTEQKEQDLNCIVNDGLVLKLDSKTVVVDGEEKHLTATEYKIMKLFMSNLGRVFSAEEIYERVWEEQVNYAVENTVMVHIRRIREKIEINTKIPKYLKVVWIAMAYILWEVPYIHYQGLLILVFFLSALSFIWGVGLWLGYFDRKHGNEEFLKYYTCVRRGKKYGTIIVLVYIVVIFVILLRTRWNYSSYLEVLTHKTELLKNMIDNVFDLAKVSSGNASLQPERLELNCLVEQIMADMQDAIREKERVFKVELAEENTEFTADSSYMYRIMQNLFGNAVKYAMDGTRIFVKTYAEGNKTGFEIMNVSSYPLDFDTERIKERFVRGDESRSTEGNGLGLAIVETYTNALGGKFNISIEGDLFKASVEFTGNAASRQT